LYASSNTESTSADSHATLSWDWDVDAGKMSMCLQADEIMGDCVVTGSTATPATGTRQLQEEVRLKPNDFTCAAPCVAGRNRLSFFGRVDILDAKALATKARSNARSFMLMADENCS